MGFAIVAAAARRRGVQMSRWSPVPFRYQIPPFVKRVDVKPR